MMMMPVMNQADTSQAPSFCPHRFAPIVLPHHSAPYHSAFPHPFYDANCDHNTPAAIAEPITPATLGAMACINR
ncbi:hypothetical protein Mal15_48500 [Stieleria maiorica]|uniref:Uncharacterized protein n=1 Tax=Stieleria maiorica TaxID=2795974 RepID=A0A5B9MPG7_9BACT|nr:hypothetical protein Mal15_48500 [Stieleria maiorica]